MIVSKILLSLALTSTLVLGSEEKHGFSKHELDGSFSRYFNDAKNTIIEKGNIVFDCVENGAHQTFAAMEEFQKQHNKDILKNPSKYKEVESIFGGIVKGAQYFGVLYFTELALDATLNAVGLGYFMPPTSTLNWLAFSYGVWEGSVQGYENAEKTILKKRLESIVITHVTPEEPKNMINDETEEKIEETNLLNTTITNDDSPQNEIPTNE